MGFRNHGILVLVATFALPLLAREYAPNAPQQGGKVGLEVALADPIMPSNKKQTTYLKVGLTGFPLPDVKTRAPVNIALVIDKSGSMTGQKISKAKRAAIAAIDRLRSDDIVSVAVYDQGVRVLLPATKLSDKSVAKHAIRQIQAGGSTALFAGVSKGAAEVRKFLDDNHVNRVILLSDGRANVGPDSPSELGEFGASLLKEKISVTTMGLGLDYHEDLMSQLAIRSNGNHLFIERADELIAVFQQEFDDVLSVIAQEVTITVKVREGLRPVRVMGQAGEIRGQDVTIIMNQLYANQERFVLLEVDVPGTAANSERGVADVSVTYANMQTKETDRLVGSVKVGFSDDLKKCQESRNRDVVEKRVLMVANEKNRIATKLRDEGRIEAARRMLLSNSDFLITNASQLNSELLRRQSLENTAQARFIDDANWKKTRKLMLRGQSAVIQQQAGYGGLSGGGYGGNGSGSGSSAPPVKTPPQSKK